MFLKRSCVAVKRPLTRSLIFQPINKAWLNDMKQFPVVGFDGLGYVELMNGKVKQVRDLEKGDKIKSSADDVEIECVIKTMVPDGYVPTYNFSGVLATNHQAIFFDRAGWFYANPMLSVSGKPPERKIGSIYNVILNKHHVIEINGTWFATVGDGLRHNEADANNASARYFKNNLMQYFYKHNFPEGFKRGKILTKAKRYYRFNENLEPFCVITNEDK